MPIRDYDNLSGLPGTCWLPLLMNLVIAIGFPISHRVEVLGLDILLKSMALLVNTPKLTFFNDRVMLKGFNAAIVATRYDDHVFQWHLIIRGNRLPYSDPWILEQGLSLESVVPKNLLFRARDMFLAGRRRFRTASVRLTHLAPKCYN
ncbi:hypothetical protein B0H67DRAFT_325177 [Lasiosphaeris hirsuta]|uniref:Uncharacterized protein n=1 Tax=Lasiosphaeris hirsuta TaxID=260670 RepID=A0AA40A269_9PEZI|nr:hypothetical protein B0H67DRAFT_325177 [Lasiosphaeris hirsuta]